MKNKKINILNLLFNLYKKKINKTLYQSSILSSKRQVKTYFILTLISGILITSNINAQVYRDSIDCSDQLSLDWVKTNGSNSIDVINDVKIDVNGDIIIIGYFSNTMNFQGTSLTSTGLKDFYIAKLTNDGNLLWVQTGGGIQDDEGIALALDDSGNIYVTGNYVGQGTFGTSNTISYGAKDIFILKYNSNGDYQWGQFIGGFNDDFAGDIIVDNNNDVAISGTYDFAMSINSDSFIGKGGKDFFIAKFDNNGVFQWTTNQGSTLDDFGLKLTCDVSNNLYVAGEFSGAINFGAMTVTAMGTKDVFLAKYSSSGNPDWGLKKGTAGDNDKLGGLYYGANQNKIYMSYKNDQALNQGQISIFNPTGIQYAMLSFGGSGVITPLGLSVDYSGAMYVSGQYSGTANFGDGDVTSIGETDYFIAKYKLDGSLGFKDVAGSTLSDAGNNIAIDNMNNIYVAGYCNNNIEFSGNPFPSQGQEDNLLVKYRSYFAFSQIDISSIDCNPNNMCVDIEITGGQAPFVYNWSGGETTQDVCGYSPGNYQIIVVDDNNCYIATDITIVSPSARPINLSTNYNICFNDTLTLDAGEGYLNYSWSPNGEITQTIDVYEGGTYSITVTDDNSCTTSLSTTVVESPNINLLPNDTIYKCINTSIELSSPGFTSYMWDNNIPTATYTTEEEGTHTLWVSDGTCYYLDTVELLNYPDYTINIGKDTTICVGDTIKFLIEGDQYASFLWHDNSTNNYYWATETEEVSVMITDTNSCVSDAKINVEVLEREIINLGQDTSYCTSVPISLSPNAQSPDNTYLWNTGETSETIEVNTSGEYWVAVTNAGACTSYDTIVVGINPQPNINLGNDISFCEGESDTIRVIGDFVTYLWNTGESTEYIYVDSGGLFSVTATDANGCFDSDTIIVIESIIEPPFLGYDTLLCNDEEYRLAPENEYYSYLWQNGTRGEYLTVREPGYYALTVSDEFGCTSSSDINIDYTTGPTIINIEAGAGQIIVGATGGTPPYSYSYDGDTWQSSYYFNSLQSDFYTIYVMDKNYCIASIETFLDQTIDVPSFFTPNGDGYNDYWIIMGLEQFPNTIVKVYDRYGKQIYEFTGNEIGWDGTYYGQPLPSDTYWYSINLKTSLSPITGHVTIKR